VTYQLINKSQTDFLIENSQMVTNLKSKNHIAQLNNLQNGKLNSLKKNKYNIIINKWMIYKLLKKKINMKSQKSKINKKMWNKITKK